MLFIDNVTPIDASTPVADLFGPMATAPCPLPVLGEDRKFLGIISRTTMLRFLDRDTPPGATTTAGAAPRHTQPPVPYW